MTYVLNGDTELSFVAEFMGYALSMGFLLAMAGSNNDNVTVECFEFSTGLLHVGGLSVSGTNGTAEDFIDFNKKMEDKVTTFILNHTNITAEHYVSIKRKDNWYLAEEMVEMGIVDRIVSNIPTPTIVVELEDLDE
jgi:ATP-dependent protease ClpP protease subunit